MCFSLTFPQLFSQAKPCTQRRDKPIGTPVGIPLDPCQGLSLRLWASSPHLKPGDLTCLMEAVAARTVFPPENAIKTDRSARPPIARPACRRFFPQCINLGLPCGSTPTANAAAFVSCLCCAGQEPQVPLLHGSPATRACLQLGGLLG